MAEGCREKCFDWDFVKFTWNFKRDYKPSTFRILEEINVDKNKLRIFKNQKEYKKYLVNLDSLI